MPAAGSWWFADGPRLAPWDVESGEQVLRPDSRFFAAVARELARRPDVVAGLRFVLTTQVEGRLPVQGDDVVVLLLADELARVPSYAHAVRLVAKTYGTRATPGPFTCQRPGALAVAAGQETYTAALRAPNLLRAAGRDLRYRRRPRVLDVPLGTYLLREVPFVGWDLRSLDVSYMGSRYKSWTDPQRPVPTRKSRSRDELARAVGTLRSTHPQLRVHHRSILSFHDAPEHAEEYSHTLMQTRVALCPRGSSMETYRFFEALKLGCVPVTEALPRRDYYDGAPGVRVRTWRELPAVLDHLFSAPAELRERHLAALAWWAAKCSPEAVARRIAAALR